MRAIIVGAGLAGLAGAYRLRQAGWDVLVLEQNEYVGGRVRSCASGDYRFELGAGQLSTGFQEYLALAHEVGLTSNITQSSSFVAVIRDARLFHIDARRPWTAAFSKLLSLRSKWVLLRTLKDFRAFDPPLDVRDVSTGYRFDTESAKAYALRRLNREIYDYLIDPLIRTYVLRSAADVSCLEWFSILRNLSGQQMIAMRGGLSLLPQALAQHVEVRCHASVSAVEHDGDRVTVSIRDAQGVNHVEHADACIVATRLSEAGQVAPHFAKLAAPALAKIEYNRALVVHIGYRRRTLSPAVGVLISRAEHQQIAEFWLDHNKVDDAAPRDHSLISVYFDEAELDGLFATPDANVIGIARTYVERIFPELVGHFDMAHVCRWPMAIPNPAPGMYKMIHELKQSLRPDDRIQFAGDYFTCVGQNSAIYWGQIAAKNLIRSYGS